MSECNWSFSVALPPQDLDEESTRRKRRNHLVIKTTARMLGDRGTEGSQSSRRRPAAGGVEPTKS